MFYLVRITLIFYHSKYLTDSSEVQGILSSKIHFKFYSLFMAMTYNIPVQSVIFSGLRGVGKTVLINSLQKKAEEKNIFCKHIEVEERNDFISQIASCSQAFLRKISAKEKFKHLIQKPLEAILFRNHTPFIAK